MDKSQRKYHLITLISLGITVAACLTTTITVFRYGNSRWSERFEELKQCEDSVTKLAGRVVHSRRVRYANVGYAATLLRSDYDSYQQRPNGKTSQNSQSVEENGCQPCCTAGPPGPPGRNGQNGRNGKGGKSGEAGTPGKMPAIPCLEGTVHKCKEACPSGEKGPKGLTGPRGDRGPAGNPGRNGTPGKAGTLGKRGIRGPSGKPGRAGEVGHQGLDAVFVNMTETGDSGPQGPRGFEGPMGPRGFPAEEELLVGEKGAPGARGAPGNPGNPGRMGAPGAAGPSGNQGICPTYCAVDGGVFHDPLSIVSNGNYDRRNGK